MRSCLICDDHAMMREALASSIGLHWPDATIALAADFPSAWRAASAAPDLILCDLGMPGAPPLEGVRGVRDAAPPSPIVVVTANEDDAVLLELFDLGVAGYIPKTSTGAIVEAAIRLVLAGGRYAPQRLVDLALARGGAAMPAQPAGFSDNAARLTERQIEVLRLLSQGESNKAIARRLSLSPATVKAYAAAVCAALGAANRTEASFRARQMGLI